MFINLTPHSIDIYSESAFVNLQQLNPTTWVADGVEGEPLVQCPSEGVARISTTTVQIGVIDGVPLYKTQYGDITGIPDDVTDEDILIVSLPLQSMAIASGHPLAPQMASPYQVVRLASNTSTVLGCTGLSFQ